MEENKLFLNVHLYFQSHTTHSLRSFTDWLLVKKIKIISDCYFKAKNLQCGLYNNNNDNDDDDNDNDDNNNNNNNTVPSPSRFSGRPSSSGNNSKYKT